MQSQEVDFEQVPDWELQYAASTRAFHTLHAEEGELRRKVALLEIEKAQAQQQRDQIQLQLHRANDAVTGANIGWEETGCEIDELRAQLDGAKNQLSTICSFARELINEASDFGWDIDFDETAWAIIDEYTDDEEYDEGLDEPEDNVVAVELQSGENGES